MTAAVRRILIYPIKSLDPVAVPEARVLATGALEGDREFALFDDTGVWINAKRDARIHRIRTEFDLANKRVKVRVSPNSQAETFHLIDQRRQLDEWFTSYFGFRTQMRQNMEMGFPDDTESPGPTVISWASLATVGAWFGLAPEETSRRFRANIELKTDDPFWEDRLFADPGNLLAFRIGSVLINGVNPCQRCAVPSRNPETGVVLDNFQRAFAEKRAAALPSWAPASRFDHYYRLSVNTRIPAREVGKSLRVGDAVDLA